MPAVLRLVSRRQNNLPPSHLCYFPQIVAENGNQRQAMGAERRKGERVAFERGINAHMMGIDGTWRRDCIMEDVSETGARLTVVGNVEGLNLKEFFLLLSSTGLAYRRCELAWVNGDQVGATFLKQGDKKKSRRPSAAPTDA
jgi:hypothetical protein